MEQAKSDLIADQPWEDRMSENADATSGSRGHLRVMTMNLLSPEHANWERRRLVLQEGLAALRPDLIALQESVVAEDLLGPEYHVAQHSRRSDDGVGAVLASRWPLQQVQEIDLRVTSRVDLPWCAAVLAEISAPQPVGPVLFVHHKPTYHIGYAHERELQAVATARFVENWLAHGDRHVILAGDFDDTPDSSSIRFWTGR